MIECIMRVLFLGSKWSGIVGVDVVIFWVVGGILVCVNGGYIFLVNLMLFIVILFF